MTQRKTKQLADQPVAQSELRKLAPKPVVWEIGDKLFEQTPLRIDRLSDVMEEITDIVLGQGRGAILDQIMDAATKGDGAKDTISQAAMPILVRTVVSIPKRLPKIVAMILVDANQQYLRDNMSARQAIQIVKTFIEQNEIGALIQDFFGLVSSVNLSVTQATTEATTEAETEKVLASDSETTVETEED